MGAATAHSRERESERESERAREREAVIEQAREWMRRASSGSEKASE